MIKDFQYIFNKYNSAFIDFKDLTFIKSLKIKNASATILSRIFEFPKTMRYHILQKRSPFYYKMRGYDFYEMLSMIDFRETNSMTHPQWWLNKNCSYDIAIARSKEKWDLDIHLEKGLQFSSFPATSRVYWEERLTYEEYTYIDDLIELILIKSNATLGKTIQYKFDNNITSYNRFSLSDVMSRFNIDENSANIIIKENRENIRVGSIRCIEYWISRGFSLEEAKITISNIQSAYSTKYYSETDIDIIRGNNHLCPEYWYNKGFTHDEVKEKLQENGLTFSLDICIEKYGEELGYLIWKDRQENWIKTRQSNPDYKILNAKQDSVSIDWAMNKANGDIELANEIRENRLREILGNNTSYSKQSVKYLAPIADYVINNFGLTVLWKNNEFHINPNLEKYTRFYYDFTVPELKYMIEYHGTAFHPKEGDYSYTQIYRRDKSPVQNEYEEAFGKDKIKEQTAISAGFDIDIIWSDNELDYKIIYEKLNEKYKDYIKRSI